MLRCATCCLVMTMSTACVSASKHEQLQAQYASANAQLAVARGDAAELRQALQAAKQHADDLALAIAGARLELTSARHRQDELESKIQGQTAEVERTSNELADLVKDRSRLKESTERMRQALVELAARKIEADRRVAEYKAMLVQFKALIEAGTIQVRIVDGRMVLTLASDVLFDTGSARLSNIGRAAVVDIASVLVTLPKRRIQIEGHTDNVPIHNETYVSNWELAASRAFTVLRTLTENGVPAGALSAASYGEYQPRAPNEDVVGRTANRRIEVVLVPDLSALPGAEELERAIAQP